MSSFRLDRFLTLYFFYPLIRSISLRNDLKIPILMYHSISDDIEDGIHPYFQVNTSPAVFAKHLKYLRDHNYSVVNLTDIRKLSSSDGRSISRQVVITFDDGYQDFYAQAFPILKDHGFPTIVFLPTSFIGNKNYQLRGKTHLNWDEVFELSCNGFLFGSHTVTHPQLSTLKNEDIRYEIKKSKEIIEDKIGKAVESFSYPYAFPDGNNRLKKFIKVTLDNCGYKNGVSTIIGTVTKSDDKFFLKRLPLNTGDDVLFFKAKLEGGYDWLHKLQYFKKLTISKNQYA